MKDTIKRIANSCFLLRGIYKRIQSKRHQSYLERKSRNLQENGYRLIKEIQDCLLNLDEVAFFDYGTLLGIVREGKIISYDQDADFGVTVRDGNTITRVRDCLSKNGFKMKSYNVLDSGIIVQDTFERYGIEFDVYYHYKDIKSRKSVVYMLFRNPKMQYEGNMWDVAIATCETINEIKLYPFHCFSVFVPLEFEKHLTYRYGEKWRVPDKTYVYWNCANTHPSELKGQIITV